MIIEVFNNQKKIKINKNKIKKVAVKFLTHLTQRKGRMLNITFVSPYSISRINRKYFKKNVTTDVIALEPRDFNKNIYSNYLGDIIICPQKAKENCKRFSTSFKKEILLYVAHGILHLLGYDDLNKKNLLKMENKQKQLLRLI